MTSSAEELMEINPLYKYRPDADRYAGLLLHEHEMDSHPIIKRNAERSYSSGSAIGAHYLNERLAPNWIPPTTEPLYDNAPKEGDFPSLSNYWSLPIFSEKAWQALRSMIEQDCEALPIVHYSGETYFIIHILRETDAIDLGRSSATYNPATKRASTIFQYAFKRENLVGRHLFRVSLQCGGGTFVSEEFRERVMKHKLKGLLFEPLPLAAGS